MGKKEVKTNAMRILERQKIPYTYETYECDEFTDGIETADKLGYEHQYVYKTLVTTGKSGEHYGSKAVQWNKSVFCRRVNIDTVVVKRCLFAVCSGMLKKCLHNKIRL